MRLHKFIKGDDFIKEGDDHKTFGINCPTKDIFGDEDTHYNKIHVYGDEKLRDKILKILIEDEAKQ